jgi:outer membrane lipoprotein carrier protein
LLFLQATTWGGESVTDRDNNIAETINRLQNTYEAIHTLKADFMQITFASGSPEAVRATGRVWFQSPGMMRWEYNTPEPQLVVVKGENVYIYEKDAGQVTILSRSHFLSTDIATAFFLGKGDIKKTFKVSEGWNSGNIDYTKLVLVPRKNNPQIKLITITLDKKNNLIREMWFEDHFGGRTRLVFSDIKINMDIDKRIFEFKIPAGVEVYRVD